ncbi:MAG: phosphoribosyltransferase family protein [Flavobacteriaceae bacterium]|jgi:pyrimidine operon attenuation protein/uracil phosphoribosyltransferase|tara:strand:- start:126 stop:623 length:498 start_codon:yes stop_codon:yes gene_type:complete
MDKKKILNNLQIKKKIKRISLQIIESNNSEEEIIIAGIEKNGFIISKKISDEIENNSDIKVKLCKIIIDKKNPRKEISTSLKLEDYQNKSMVLIDDVLNSGSTLIYAVKHFLDTDIKKIKTAVLVDRNHKKFPIKADFKGLSLSTSIQNHVEVVFDKGIIEAFLV